MAPLHRFLPSAAPSALLPSHGSFKRKDRKCCKRATDEYMTICPIDVEACGSPTVQKDTIHESENLDSSIDFDWENYMQKNNINENQFPPHCDGNTSQVSPPYDVSRRKRASSEGMTSNENPKKVKAGDVLLDNLISLRKEELKCYKDLKEKQIKNYKEVKLLQMEKNDPSKDPYSIVKYIEKLNVLALLIPMETLKVINSFKKDIDSRMVFMSIKDLEVLKLFFQDIVCKEG